MYSWFSSRFISVENWNGGFNRCRLSCDSLREERERTWSLINPVTAGDSRSEGQSYTVTYFLHYQMHKLMRVKTFVISEVHSS